MHVGRDDFGYAACEKIPDEYANPKHQATERSIFAILQVRADFKAAAHTQYSAKTGIRADD